MNIYLAQYEERGCSCCRHDEEIVAVTANSKSEALGFCLEYRSESKEFEWIITNPISTEEAGITDIYGDEY